MNTIIGRFITFLKKEKTKNFVAFVFYVSLIVMYFANKLPQVISNTCLIILILITLLCYPIYLSECFDNLYERNRGNLVKNLIKEVKKITKEMLMFIPIYIISIGITSFVMVGQSENQTSIETTFYEAPIYNSIFGIIIGPIIEEFIFRFLPYRFIKNRTIYIIVSSVIFASVHVIDDPNALYYIWFYMMRPLYYGYRYHKTKDILIPFFMHIFNNLVSTLLFVFS